MKNSISTPTEKGNKFYLINILVFFFFWKTRQKKRKDDKVKQKKNIQGTLKNKQTKIITNNPSLREKNNNGQNREYIISQMKSKSSIIIHTVSGHNIHFGYIYQGMVCRPKKNPILTGFKWTHKILKKKCFPHYSLFYHPKQCSLFIIFVKKKTSYTKKDTHR